MFEQKELEFLECFPYLENDPKLEALQFYSNNITVNDSEQRVFSTMV